MDGTYGRFQSTVDQPGWGTVFFCQGPCSVLDTEHHNRGCWAMLGSKTPRRAKAVHTSLALQHYDLMQFSTVVRIIGSKYQKLKQLLEWLGLGHPSSMMWYGRYYAIDILQPTLRQRRLDMECALALGGDVSSCRVRFFLLLSGRVFPNLAMNRIVYWLEIKNRTWPWLGPPWWSKLFVVHCKEPTAASVLLWAALGRLWGPWPWCHNLSLLHWMAMVLWLFANENSIEQCRTNLGNSKQESCWLHRSGTVGRNIWRRGRHRCSRRRRDRRGSRHRGSHRCRDCQPGSACCAMGALPKLTERKNYLNNLDVYYSSYLDIH